MTKFLEIKNIYGKIVLINIEEIDNISEGIDIGYNLIWVKSGNVFNTYETIEEIKAKLWNTFIE